MKLRQLEKDLLAPRGFFFCRQQESEQSMSIESIALTRIRTDGGTQLRPTMDVDALNEYTRLLQEGTPLPAISVVFDGRDYWLWDGFHRFDAAHRAGLTSYPADVERGTLEDALEHALKANATNGLRRDPGTMQAVVLLADKLHPNDNDPALAKRCGVSWDTVRKYRPQPKSGAPDLGTPTRPDARGRNMPITYGPCTPRQPDYEPEYEPEPDIEEMARGTEQVGDLFGQAAVQALDSQGMQAQRAGQWISDVVMRMPFQTPSEAEVLAWLKMTDPDQTRAQARRLRRVADQIAQVLGLCDAFVRPGPRAAEGGNHNG